MSDYDPRIILVAGRFDGPDEIAKTVGEYLTDEFSVTIVHPLGEEGIDGKDRWLVFIHGNEFGDHTFEYILDRLNKDPLLGASVHESMEDAMEYAKEKYEFGRAEREAMQRREEFFEKFPRLRSVELEMFSVTDSLMHLGRCSLTRGLLEGLEVVCVTYCAQAEGDDLRATPLAILVSDASFSSQDEDGKLHLELGIMGASEWE